MREGKRRDWGAGGHDFHWWCTDAPDAFDGDRPVYQELRDEIIALVGEWAYARLADYVESRDRQGRHGRATNGAGRTRVTESFLPHPALRRG